MIGYQTNENGYFVGVVYADESPKEPGKWVLPGKAVWPEPPVFGRGYAARWVDGAWQIVPAPGAEKSPPAPLTLEQVIAERRANAVIDRGPLCLALYATYILSAESAKAAAKGNWPAEFDGFLAGLNPIQALAAEIAWADATVVRYSNPLLQQAALDFAGTEAAATMVLDQLFGIGS